MSKKVQESTFEYLQRRCDEAGTNLTEICREANIDRSSVERWKEKDPKSIQILKDLESVIAKKEQEKNS